MEDLMDKDIKVIALDLDGTLLNNNKDISNRNLNAILKCHENGKQVIIATARPPRSVKSLLPKVLLDICSFVYYNGALICDYELGFEKNITIPRHLTQQIIAFCYENDPHCTISLEVKDKWYSNKPINHSLVFNPLFSPQILTNKELVRLNANKILLTEMGNIENIEHYFKRELHIVVTDNRTLMQLMNKDVSKASGLLTLCHLYKVKQS